MERLDDLSVPEHLQYLFRFQHIDMDVFCRLLVLLTYFLYTGCKERVRSVVRFVGLGERVMNRLHSPPS